VVQAIAEALIGGWQPGDPAPGGRRGRPALVRVDRRAAFMGRGIAMKNVASLAAAVAIVSALLPGAVEGARTGPGLFTLRLDGYVGDPPAGRRERADLHLRAGDTNLRFQVTRATVSSSHMMPSTIFNRVRPYRPNFILRGPRALVQRVEKAAAGDHLHIVGGWRPGSRDLLLSSVEPAKP
jgi:hypothetical protein